MTVNEPPNGSPANGIAAGGSRERPTFSRVLLVLAATVVLLVGAVDVLSGKFGAFNSRRDRISAETILASAAIPTFFRSVRLDGGTYWDGLFSQNPPIKELTDEKPDEIWVIQINVGSSPTTSTGR